jgi:hypothetical protein
MPRHTSFTHKLFAYLNVIGRSHANKILLFIFTTISIFELQCTWLNTHFEIQMEEQNERNCFYSIFSKSVKQVFDTFLLRQIQWLFSFTLINFMMLLFGESGLVIGNCKKGENIKF